MKILIGPDLHCWPTTYESAQRGEEPARLIEWKNITDKIVEIAEEEKPQAAFFPGDLFNIANPKPIAIIETISFFSRLEEICPVFACAGNHDFLGHGETSFVDVVAKSCKCRWGITECKTYEDEQYDLSVVVIPYMKPTLLDPSGKPEKVSSKLLELAKLESNKKHKILMTHWPVKEAIYANGFGPKNEPVYPLDDLKKLGYNVCIMGHVHKNQVLNEDPLVIHPGVAIRTELNEASVTPSVYIYNLETRELSARELPARKISHFKFSDKICDFANGEWKNEIPDVENKIVVAKYEVSEDLASTIDHQSIIDAIYKRGAFHVDGVYPIIVRKERNRGAEIDCTLSRVEALDKWYDASGEDPAYKLKVISKFKELEKQI